MASFFQHIFLFYQKYITWVIIVLSFLMATYAVFYIDLDLIYYAECSDSMKHGLRESPDMGLGFSDLKILICLVCFMIVIFIGFFTFFPRVKNAFVLFLSSFLIKTVIAIYGGSSLILNLGFIKILRGLTEAEKCDFLATLQTKITLTFEDLPLEIQRICNPEVFKSSTLSYINSLQEAIPTDAASDVLSTNIFTTCGTFL
jgi:hypothetical protein